VLNISCTYRGSSGTPRATAKVSVPRLEENYVLPQRFLEAPPWYLDRDLFLEELSDLNLNSRTKRTLEEALDALGEDSI
jgi:hypothetical protein